MTTPEKPRQKEIAIYKATLELLSGGAEWGAVTVQQIAEAADIGKGTVYEYFPSKDAILRAVTVWCLQSELDRLQAAAAPCQTLDDLVEAMLCYITDLVRDRAGIYRVIAGAMGVARPVGGGCGPHPALLGRLRQALCSALDRLRQNGELPADLTDDYCLYALMAGMVSCISGLTELPDKDIAPPAMMLANTRRLLHRALGA